MTHRRLFVFAYAILTLLFGCTPTAETPTPTQEVEPAILISEIMAGGQDNNNLEFIELYNSGTTVIDLEGWSLWYRLESSEGDLPIFEWNSKALIPPQGHYLLARADQEIGVISDAEFDQSLNTNGGGLAFRDPDGNTLDMLAWGKNPPAFTEGAPAPELENGLSLERNPGGQEGNGADTDDNQTDFNLLDIPNPQNVGSPRTPTIEAGLAIHVSAPASVEPGSNFEYLLTLTNQSNTPMNALIVEMPIPGELTLGELPPEVTPWENSAIWELSSLDPGDKASTVIPVTAPWAYLTAQVSNYNARSKEHPSLFFGETVRTSIEGGVIPIQVARNLGTATVTVEGTATMYTGGYFSGSGNVKFYLEDQSAGVQVYVPGGEGVLNIPIGASVRVTGQLELYRGAVEIIPATPADVQVLNTSGHWEPSIVSIQQAAGDAETIPGRLVTVEGRVVRIEEFTYSYEMDLIDEDNQILNLYIDKLTEINVEQIELGQLYKATGLIEIRDSAQQLYPRIQSDLTQRFPQELLVTADAPSAVQSSESFTVTLSVTNHTPDTLSGVEIWAPLPSEHVGRIELLDNGYMSDGQARWVIEDLSGHGGTDSVHYLVNPLPGKGVFLGEGYRAFADEWPEPALGDPLRVFLGTGVPIWAIQGPGFSSPYKLKDVTTRGVIIGAFPELGGFWIQEETTDEEAASSGLFVLTEELAIEVEIGDSVEIDGRVREISGQTLLQIDSIGDVRTMGEGLDLPAAQILDPPILESEAAAYYESLEGMLVEVSDSAVAVGPTSKYGEYVLVLRKHNRSRLWRSKPTGMMIMVDDGSIEVHSSNATLPYTVSTGDQVSALVGPLAYTFGHYKIEPIALPEVSPTKTTLARIQPAETDEFSLMTWNVENLFDILDPHPSDPPRPRKSEYDLALTKVANTILWAGAPSIVGLQEVENIGVLEDVAAHPSIVEYGYQPRLIEGSDSRGIDVGYLVREDVRILETVQHIAPEGLTSRPPLLLHVELGNESSPLNLYFLNNHFTSLAGGELATEPRRTAQAAWNASIVEDILAIDPQAFVAVVGDLNSFFDSLPIDTLRQAGLHHVFEVLPEEERYNYIFEGVSQTLDHILVTPPLMDQLVRVEVLHANADFPPPPPDDESPLRKSDHDPVIAIFSLAHSGD